MAIARFAKAQSQVFIVINNLILSQTSPFKQKSNRSGSHQGTKTQRKYLSCFPWWLSALVV
jgi:hypothetical protein